jgi:hypothetical protein
VAQITGNRVTAAEIVGNAKQSSPMRTLRPSRPRQRPWRPQSSPRDARTPARKPSARPMPTWRP